MVITLSLYFLEVTWQFIKQYVSNIRAIVSFNFNEIFDKMKTSEVFYYCSRSTGSTSLVRVVKQV